MGCRGDRERAERELSEERPTERSSGSSCSPSRKLQTSPQTTVSSQTVNKEASRSAGPGKGKPGGHSANRNRKTRGTQQTGRLSLRSLGVAQRPQGMVKPPQICRSRRRPGPGEQPGRSRSILLGFCWLLGDPGWTGIVEKPVA